MSTINPMVTTIVQHIMTTQNDVESWRKDLIRNHIFEAQEARDLSEREVSLVQHALLIQAYSQLNSDELLKLTAKFKLNYKVNFDDEFQMTAICY